MPNPFEEIKLFEGLTGVCETLVKGGDASAAMLEDTIFGVKPVGLQMTNDIREFQALIMRGAKDVAYIPKDFHFELPPNFRELCGLPAMS